MKEAGKATLEVNNEESVSLVIGQIGKTIYGQKLMIRSEETEQKLKKRKRSRNLDDSGEEEKLRKKCKVSS